MTEMCSAVYIATQEPMYYGYLFALGLLSSTLLGAILTSHFNYQVRGNHQVKQLLFHLNYAKPKSPLYVA